MDSPETEKTTTSASISLTNTSAAISIGSPQVLESPLSCYISNLSPIKPAKGLLIGEGFTALSSPPLVFSSPHVNSNHETSFVKRAQYTDSPSALVSTNNAAGEKSVDGLDDSENCARQLCRRLVTGFQESDDKIAEQSPCGSSEFLDNFLADSDDVDSCNSMHAVSPHLKQSNDGLPESSQSVLNAIVKEPEEPLLLSNKVEKGNQENAVFDCYHVRGEKQQKGDDYPSPEFNDTESDFSNRYACDKQQNEDSCAQDAWAFPQNDFQCTPQSEPQPLEIFNACEFGEENAGEVSNSLSEYSNCKQLSQVRQNQRGMHRRYLQFEEVALNAIGNRSHSSNLTGNNIKSTLLSMNVTNESQKSSGMYSNPNSVKQNPVSLSQPVAALLPPCSKPLGIGLHLNSIVSGMPTGSSSVASIKLAEDYNSFQGVETVVKSSHLRSRNTYIENSSHCGEDEMHERNTSIMAGSTTSEFYSAMEPLTVPNHAGCQATLDGTEKFISGHIDNLEEFNKPSPKKKRIKTDGDGFKGCNCKKTKCLKLYCDCFAAGVYCGDACACQGCFNRLENEEMVHETRHQIESRNPLAFAPKIVPRLTEIPLKKVDGTQTTPSLARHKRGCNCKKSMCLKKYCECYQANVGCSSGCRCEGCKNVYGRTEEYVATMHGSEGTLNENLEMVATVKDFSHAEIHGLTPVTPSFQYSDHGMDAQRPHPVSRRCLPSPDSDLISYANSTSSPKNSDNDNMLLEEKNDSLDSGYYTWQISYDNVDMADPDHTSPRSNDIPSLYQLTPLQHHPSMNTMASSTASKSKDWSNMSHSQPFSTGGSLRRLTPPITPLTRLGATKSFKHVGPQTEEDDTPEILKDNTKSPIQSVKVSSPNKKRVSPPYCHVLEHGSNSMGSLKSGRKFILKAVPSFPPLTPCIDSTGGSGANRSECADNSGGSK